MIDESAFVETPRAVRTREPRPVQPLACDVRDVPAPRRESVRGCRSEDAGGLPESPHPAEMVLGYAIAVPAVLRSQFFPRLGCARECRQGNAVSPPQDSLAISVSAIAWVEEVVSPVIVSGVAGDSVPPPSIRPACGSVKHPT